MLAGEGGDELFAGYGRYRDAARWLFAKPMRRKGILDGLDVLREPDPTRAWRAGFAQAGVDARRRGRTLLQNAQAQDIATWLPGDLLTKVDRMLMAHGVEGRVPFLDPRMADFAFTLPDRFKIKRRQGKLLLRQWLASAMPAAKPFSKKRGFTVPVGEWMAARGRDVGALVAAQDCIAEICKPDPVRALFHHKDGRAAKAAWTLLFYALWHKAHIEGADTKGDVFSVLEA